MIVRRVYQGRPVPRRAWDCSACRATCNYVTPLQSLTKKSSPAGAAAPPPVIRSQLTLISVLPICPIWRARDGPLQELRVQGNHPRPPSPFDRRLKTRVILRYPLNEISLIIEFVNLILYVLTGKKIK